jgi:hypothetical protein
VNKSAAPQESWIQDTEEKPCNFADDAEFLMPFFIILDSGFITLQIQRQAKDFTANSGSC